ncbi:MAG: FAD-binding oxidoreductase [Gammaproteobacteria bacterium]|nr:FAD-binding oxidoreductase [Gammaproteobacteria bacterium]MBV9725638.1 FAD-binding oxidoreductase [Gammaproteobacteria bacterium]
MRRRTFCAAGLAALAAASLPLRRVSAAGEEVSTVALDGRELTLNPAEVADLRASLRGQLLTRGDTGYDDARKLWNPAFDRKPALIARCLGAADVTRAVSFAAAHGLLTAVRGGGHSLSGQSACDRGLMIDVAPMRAVEVDPQARRARVQAGALLGHLDREAQAFGLATTAGTVADTGVAGLTLGGGVGRIGRRFGLTSDNLKSVELVPADGRWVRASEAENQDLFWAVRGGGGNFGVATCFDFQLHEVSPQMYGGQLFYPLADGRQLLRHFADYVATAPDELYVDVVLESHPKLGHVVNFDVCYSGKLSDAERVLAGLRKLGKPLQDELGPKTYLALQGSVDTPGFSKFGVYVKGGLIYGLSPALIDAVVAVMESAPSDMVEVWFQQQGGAISRLPAQATAYWGRSASHNMGLVGAWPAGSPDAEGNKEWVRKAWAQIEPLTRGNYVNIANTDDRDSRVREAYGDNWQRLQQLKKRYDPANLFRLNANIKPA